MARRPARRGDRRRSRRVGRQRLSSGRTTAALATVLLLLTLLVVGSTALTGRAATDQARALEVSRLLQTARSDVAVQMLYARQYQLEPSLAVRDRYLGSADSVTATLEQIRERPGPSTTKDAEALLVLQSDYRASADAMIAAVAVNDPRSREIDALDVAPAYYSLQQRVDEVTARYDQQAQALVDRMLGLQTTALIGTILGFSIGLALMTVIYRTVLGYQRELVRTAADSEQRALHDALTGLPNRAFFATRLTAALQRTGDAGRGMTAVLLIDLDGFKRVNDGLGHGAGDELLVEVGRRLQALARDSDTVARLGGDEFAVLLPLVDDVDAALAVARRAIVELRREFVVGGRPVTIGGSIGIAASPLHVHGDEVVQLADAAMYRAKTEMIGVAVFDPVLDQRTGTELGLLHEITALLDGGDPTGQLGLHYQPQVDLTDGSVSTVEALLRWQHPDRGPVAPGEVLPLVARAGLDGLLTDLVLDRALAQTRRWLDDGLDLQVAVNVSPACLLRAAFADGVAAALARHRVPAENLQIELVESAVLTDPARCAEVIGAVRAMGVRISLDDFGTGYSSLSHLRDLDLDEIKVDKSFVTDLARTGDDVVVRVAARLGQELRLRVVAEGVEDLAVLEWLRVAGCTSAQGFGLARPVPAADVPAACRQARRAAGDAAAGAGDAAAGAGGVPRPRTRQPEPR